MYDSAKKNFPTASSLQWNPKEIGDFTISLLGYGTLFGFFGQKSLYYQLSYQCILQ